MTTLSLSAARRHWARALGLHDQTDDPVEAARRAGWPRTLGGVDAYVALRARGPVAKEAIDAALQDGRIRVSPAARGCIFLVPEDEAALAMAMAEDLSSKRNARDMSKLGVEDAELDAVGEAVLARLGDAGPLTTDALRRSLPEGTVRSFGAPGKKIGVSSSLPPTLRRLEFAGAIERTPVTGTLDCERYLWRLPVRALAPAPADPAARRTAIARLFLQRGGPLSVAELAAFTGYGKRDCAAAIAACGATEVEVEGRGAAFLVPEQLDTSPTEPSDTLRFVAFEEAYVVLHGGPGGLTDPRHHDITIRAWGRGRPEPIGTATHLASRTLLRGDELVGLWEYSVNDGDVAWATFDACEAAETARIHAATEPLAALLTELGHARTFNMDKDPLVQKRADGLKAAGIDSARA